MRLLQCWKCYSHSWNSSGWIRQTPLPTQCVITIKPINQELIDQLLHQTDCLNIILFFKWVQSPKWYPWFLYALFPCGVVTVMWFELFVVGVVVCTYSTVWKKYIWNKRKEFTIRSTLTGTHNKGCSLTLQLIASSVCKTTMMATVDTAITLVSSRTTGQKVRTSTEPEITMATRISVQRNHSNGMIHKTWK